MNNLTINQERQLAQLARHNPTLHESVVGELATIHPIAGNKVAGRVIGDGMRILAEQLSQSKPLCKTLSKTLSETLPKTPAKPLPVAVPGQTLFDLVIASKKYGYGSTDHAEAPILWWKLAGQPKEELYPRRRVSVVDAVVQERLAGYELVANEVKPNMVIRKYRRVL